MGWLNDITEWLREALTALWEAVVEFFTDFLILLVEAVLTLVRVIVEALPVPDFLETTSICGILNQAGPVAAWAISTFHVAEGMSAIAAAVAFRLLRKLLTLFQW